MSRLRRTFIGAALLLAGCAGPAYGPVPNAAAEREIVQLMQGSAEAWNRRDLDEFLLPYLDSPDITFVGSSGLIRGKAAIRQHYASGSLAPGRDPGRLSFRDIQVRMLGGGYALAVGRYEVRLPGHDLATGLFSLTLQRTPQGWRIIHDHSS